ncbi:protein Btn1p [[Candida] jaroonii]|uniref:Protein Btn1p n=1 Tax=[Candida] jaroonii TaxID=467808 RepID=A0ACA9Y930_9ASCO|nr:protein Btn1p [[Candida] jaroonii]
MKDSHRIFTSFLGFGLLNNILYVVILSAAVDLVGSQTPKAVVLLSDILPAFLLKLAAPFFIHLIPYKTRLWLLVGLSMTGMFIISLVDHIKFKIFGICMASLSSGLGELTFLQLTHYYDELHSIGGFSSGTGVAGLGGSFLFMLLTNIMGVSISWTLLLFSVLPLGFIILYYLLLPPMAEEIRYEALDDYELTSHSFKNHFFTILDQIRPLLRPYMIPLCTVYISEYVINQGVSPTLLFPLEELPRWLFKSFRDIYVVYGFLYQLGVFISRSSINFGFRFKNLYLLSILQFINVLITITQSVYFWPFPKIWFLLVLILYEGLLGGLSYVNTFYSVSEESSKNKREFNMGCVGMSDSLGIVIAGLINYNLERSLCNAQISRGRDWCQRTK